MSFLQNFFHFSFVQNIFLYVNESVTERGNGVLGGGEVARMLNAVVPHSVFFQQSLYNMNVTTKTIWQRAQWET